MQIPLHDSHKIIQPIFSPKAVTTPTGVFGDKFVVTWREGLGLITKCHVGQDWLGRHRRWQKHAARPVEDQHQPMGHGGACHVTFALILGMHKTSLANGGFMFGAKGDDGMLGKGQMLVPRALNMCGACMA